MPIDKVSMEEARYGADSPGTFLEIAHDSRQVPTLEGQKRLSFRSFTTTIRKKGSVMRQTDSPRWRAVLSFLCRDPWQAVAKAVIMKESKALAV